MDRAYQNVLPAYLTTILVRPQLPSQLQRRRSALRARRRKSSNTYRLRQQTRAMKQKKRKPQKLKKHRILNLQMKESQMLLLIHRSKYHNPQRQNNQMGLQYHSIQMPGCGVHHYGPPRKLVHQSQCRHPSQHESRRNLQRRHLTHLRQAHGHHWLWGKQKPARVSKPQCNLCQKQRLHLQPQSTTGLSNQQQC